MNFPTLPSLLGRGRDPGLPFVGMAPAIVLTGASGVWVPTRRNAIIVATGPGGPGTTTGTSINSRTTTGGRPGCAGGTAIKFADMSQISSCTYQVGQSGTTDDTILNIPGATSVTGSHGTNTTPGGASGGDLNFNGGMGAIIADGLFPNLGFTGGECTTFPNPGSGSAAMSYTVRACPGGASFWGGCDVVTGTPSVYGAGGWCGPGAAAGNGAPGVIFIIEF